MKPKFALAALIALALTACEPNEMYPAGGAIPLGSGNSGGYSAPAKIPAQQAAPLAPAKQMPMIDNPDEPYEEWEIDQVWSDSQTEAARRCHQIAEDHQVKFVRVERVASNSKRWRCIVSNK